MKYLYKTGISTWHLDHRLTPEVRAMLVSMTSRTPLGGMQQRYTELVEAVAADLWPGKRTLPYVAATSWAHAKLEDTDFNVIAQVECVHSGAEDRLCEYPLHPKVVEFFNRFVGDYGHGSILEATGSPVVYSDGLSWYSSYLLFDGPLVIGQENSTRAVTKSDWPMCREAHVPYDTVKAERDAHYDQRRDTALTMTEVADSQFFQHLEKIAGVIHPGLQELHEGWMQVFVAEKAAWEERLKDPVIRQAHGIKDKEAFRPSLDRARWALPGTISTGVAFASHIRERSRALRDAKSVAGGAKEAWDVFDEIEQAYRAAVPGIGALGLKEAVYGSGGRVPTHLLHGIVDDDSQDVSIHVEDNSGPVIYAWPSREDDRQYIDPVYNHLFRVHVEIYCSLAVARDWHRHRTFYPWTLDLVRQGPDGVDAGKFQIDHHYEPISGAGGAQMRQLLARSTELYDQFIAAGDTYRGMLCLPLGTRALMSGSAGLRDALYTFELRAHAVGANFEYEEQARIAMQQLTRMLHTHAGDKILTALKLSPPIKTLSLLK